LLSLAEESSFLLLQKLVRPYSPVKFIIFKIGYILYINEIMKGGEYVFNILIQRKNSLSLLIEDLQPYLNYSHSEESAQIERAVEELKQFCNHFKVFLEGYIERIEDLKIHFGEGFTFEQYEMVFSEKDNDLRYFLERYNTLKDQL